MGVLSVEYPTTVLSRSPTITRARIYTAQELDREERSSYELTILAEDTTVLPLNNTSPLTITVVDVNDNRPQFGEELFSFEVPEETLSDGGFIAEINVRSNILHPT